MDDFHTLSVQLKSLEIKNFRCFKNKTIDFNTSLILIQGLNGKGKTSLLEALYYACYLRSFKSHTPKELVYFDATHFFIKLDLQEVSNAIISNHTVQVGFSGAKRLVKIDQKIITSYKDLVNHYRIVCLTEDDLDLIKEGPKTRRFFIDQALLILEPSTFPLLKEARTILEQRNQLLLQRYAIDTEQYYVWTLQLWNNTQSIQKKRIHLLSQIETIVNQLLHDFFDPLMYVELTYIKKKIASHEDLESFLKNNMQLYNDEIKYGRSLFGSHLDDFLITLHKKSSRDFSSRGQQKLIVTLIKIAQAQLLAQLKGGVIFLLDDFMTDFDADRIAIILTILVKMNVQLIFTSPLLESPLEKHLRLLNAQLITIE